MDRILEYMVGLRRKFHRRPEIAFAEHETQREIEAELSALGLPFREVKTGVIADLCVGAPITFAFRADMDALPVTERSGAEYASEIPGMMHACGHDGHMALLLGFARWCAEHRERLAVNVRFLFQPGEEGSGGARSMIEGGALEGVEEIYAFHLDPSVPPGTIGLAYGPSLAGDFEFDAVFAGESAHCAEKSRGRDALAAACEFALSLGDLAGKGRSVLHAGRLVGGSARNVVAGEARVECTMRYFEEKERDRLVKLMNFQLAYLSDRYGARGRLERVTEYIPLRNSRPCVDKLRALSGHVMLDRRYLAEDFAFYLAECRGALAWLGVRRDPETKLHAADFDFDETCLLHGLGIYQKLVEKN